jgi:ribosomal protein S18 acetylase RimI-like enzyme
MLEIRPYDIIHVKTSFEFLMDTFRISFGLDKSLWPNNLGNYEFDKYRADIEKILANTAFSTFSVWHEEKLIGQIELKKLNETPPCGYVSFYYLIPEYRNKGFGKQLDDFALSEFKRQGLPRVRLTVSELNLAGQKFYDKNGWRTLGPDPSRPLGITMEKDL